MADRSASDPAACIVIVTVDAPADAMTTLVAHARIGIERFDACEGFIDGALHVSDDGTRLVQYLRWTSPERYEACRDDPSWDELPSTSPFMELVGSGVARLDARTYGIVAHS